jgi:hypothetical protein
MEDEGAHTSDAPAFLSHLSPHIAALGGTHLAFTPYKPMRFEALRIRRAYFSMPAFSFIYGIPPKATLDEARKKGIVTLGTATAPDEVIALEQAGVDIVVASGFEAGGHRGSFLRPAEDSLTGTFSLVPQTVDAVKVRLWRLAASPTLAALSRPWHWELTACRWAPSFSPAKSRERTRCIARPFSAKGQDTPPRLEALQADWHEASTMSCSKR